MSVSNYVSDYPTVGDFFLAQVQNAIMQIINNTFSPLSEGMHDLLVVLMVLSITVYGLRITLNDSKASGREFVVTLIWGAVSLYITEPNFYASYIVETVWSLSDAFASFMLAGEFGQMSLFGAISKNFVKVFYFIGELFKVWSVGNIYPLIIGLLMGLIYGAFYAAALIITLFVSVLLGIMFIWGAIVIPLAAFEMWRAVFKSWVQAILKYAAVGLYVATVILICNQIITVSVSNLILEATNNTSYVADLGTFGAMSSNLAVVLLAGCFGIALLKKSLEITSEITGGVMGDTKGAVSGAWNDSMSAVKGIGGVAKAYKGIQSLRSKM